MEQKNRKNRNKTGIGLLCIMLLLVILTGCGASDTKEALKDGSYTVYVKLLGGTGKASVASPASVSVEDGQAYAQIVFSSKHYDYMLVDGVKYMDESVEDEEENSTFTIPIDGLDCELDIVADTTAMSVPHEIEYHLIFRQDEEELAGAEKEYEAGQEPDDREASADRKETTKEADGGIDFTTLKKTGGVSLLYATQFQIEEYGVYKMITIGDERFLLVPEGEEAVANLPADVTMLRQPKKAYVVSTSVMDLLQAIDALDDVRLSGTKQEDWYIQAAKDAMADGDMLYAGKYNQPDYEKIISENCDLAIENTMILHNPEVKEKLEALGIPVLVERSSYETHPLGRLEWIRLYGVLFGKEEQADAFYQEQVAKVEPIMKKDATDQTMAFFYVTSNGSVNVRKPGDYIAKMIQLAGGSYLPQAVKEDDENALSTMNMQMEDFYAQAKDADILIYNSTIEGELDSVDTLLAKSPLFADFKAVKEGKVYCTTADFFQETTGIASFIEDLHAVMTGDTSHELKYLKEVK